MLNVVMFAVFPYITGDHDVYEVSEADLASCAKTSLIQTWTALSSIVILTAAGSHFYICSVDTQYEVERASDCCRFSSRFSFLPYDHSTASPTITPQASGPRLLLRLNQLLLPPPRFLQTHLHQERVALPLWILAPLCSSMRWLLVG